MPTYDCLSFAALFMQGLRLIVLWLLCAGCSDIDRSIKIKGSDTEVNLTVLLAEAYHKTNPALFISVSGGGSGLGIASLMNETTDLANSSRNISTEEIQLFQKRNIEIDSFVFAQDAIAFVVSSSLAIDSISTDQLAQVLSGGIKNWQHFGLPAMPINIYGRQSNSGTHSFIKKKLKIEFSPYAKEMNGSAQILEAIRADHSGMGYVGAGYVIKGGMNDIKVLKVYHDNSLAYSPLDKKAIDQRLYFFQRPLFQFYDKKAYDRVKAFLDFEQTTEGKAIIESAGYYTANEQP